MGFKEDDSRSIQESSSQYCIGLFQFILDKGYTLISPRAFFFEWEKGRFFLASVNVFMTRSALENA